MGIFSSEKDNKGKGPEKAEKDKNDLISEKLEHGFIRCRVIIEMMGAPKEHLSKTFKDYIDKINENRNIILISKQFARPKKQDKLFVMFVEIELLVKDSTELVFFCLDYMPSSIEIIEPSKINYSSQGFAAFLNDLQARMHRLDAHIKTLKARSTILERNASLLLRNNVMIVLKEKDKSLDELSRNTGIPQDQLSPFLEKLISEGWIKRVKDLYSLKSKK